VIYVFDCSTNWLFSFFSPLSLSLKQCPLITQQWPLNIINERKSFISLTLNEKLKMIKVDEKDMSKAQENPRPLVLNSQVLGGN
jgi:hypothetical protein